jgi:tetratricopeptide (TPR) repeat protein
MDGHCRLFGRAFAFLIAGTVGCSSANKQPDGPNLSLLSSKTQTIRPEAGEATVARAVSTTSDAKKKEPIKPATLVAVGAYRDQLAANPEMSFADAEQVRASARQAYHEALKLDPKCVAAYIGLAKSYAAIEDAQQAFAMYQQAVNVIPNDANLWFEKGITHARFKDFEGALASMYKANQIDPDNRLFKRTIGLTLARAGMMDDALKTLKTCMKEEEACYSLARMCHHLERDDLSRDYLTKAIKAHPTYMPAHEMLASMNNPNAMNAIQSVDYKEAADGTRLKVDGIE